MASGVKDKVAIVGMGCTTFGEHWDKGPEDLMVEAFEEALADAKIERSQIEAAWMGNALDDINVGNSALPLAHALRLKTIPVSRVENMCATGSEALRAAVYAVAAGAVDFALALGVEKLKDTGYGGLPLRTKGLANDLWLPYGSAPGSFAQLAGAYAAKHRLNGGDLKRAMAHVSWKSHQNAGPNPRAHLRKPVDMETILKAPMIADPLGLYDCCGVSDGAACAIVTTPDIARGLGVANPVTVKAVQISASHGWEMQYGAWDGSYVLNTREAAACLRKDARRTTFWRAATIAPARSRARSTVASNVSDTRSAPRASAWPTRSIPSYWAAPAPGSSAKSISASRTILAARRSIASPPCRSSAG
jgi:acetyl-CoA C-acetyltransferase